MTNLSWTAEVNCRSWTSFCNFQILKSPKLVQNLYFCIIIINLYVYVLVCVYVCYVYIYLCNTHLYHAYLGMYAGIFYWYYHECIIQSLNCTFAIISFMYLPWLNRQEDRLHFFLFLMLGGSWRNGSLEQIMTLPVPELLVFLYKSQSVRSTLPYYDKNVTSILEWRDDSMSDVHNNVIYINMFHLPKQYSFSK